MRTCPRLAGARGSVAGLAVALAVACGPAVEADPMVELPARDEDAAVLVFVRDESVPACPWEVIGTISARNGETLATDGFREARDAARRIGGQAVLLATRSDREGQVIRFLDPRSLCDPASGPTRP